MSPLPSDPRAITPVSPPAPLRDSLFRSFPTTPSTNVSLPLLPGTTMRKGKLHFFFIATRAYPTLKETSPSFSSYPAANHPKSTPQSQRLYQAASPASNGPPTSVQARQCSSSQATHADPVLAGASIPPLETVLHPTRHV